MKASDLILRRLDKKIDSIKESFEESSVIYKDLEQVSNDLWEYEELVRKGN